VAQNGKESIAVFGFTLFVDRHGFCNALIDCFGEPGYLPCTLRKAIRVARKPSAQDASA